MRIIVLAASIMHADAWRRVHNLSLRQVVMVTPHNVDRVLRDLSGDVEVVVHETWRPTPEVRELVDHHLAIIRCTSRDAMRWTPDMPPTP